MERNKKVGSKGHKQMTFEVCLALLAICHVECCRDTLEKESSLCAEAWKVST